jgi:type II secretory pathway pseudopilin PulG
MKIVIAILGGVAVLALAVSGWTTAHANSTASHDQQVINSQAREIRSLTNHVDNIGQQVGSISQPSDPLSAYNQICNQQMTNGSTGANQTFYFPCTNSAQTIPQPGG